MIDFYEKYPMYDKSNVIHETAIIYPNVTMGKNNVIGAFTVIGSNGEIRGVNQDEFEGNVIIGNNNTISEHVTIQRPFKNTSTEIGNDNIIMAHAHIGHDVKIGNNTEICSGTIIGGYAEIKANAKLKLGVTIRNRKIVGEGSIVGMCSVVVKDVADGIVVLGNPAKEQCKTKFL